MALQNIERFSLSYALLKYFSKFWHHRVFYRKVQYAHREKVPVNEHIIFTANHQNALMDALAIGYAFNNQPVFVARSDIFSNKLIGNILYWLKILPVYRIRDGYESLKKNELTFKKTVDVILNKNGFVILPEGNHAGFRRLRPLKKGFARIAFQSEEAEKFSLDIKIIPVGIEYEKYENYRATLLVVFGNPLEVSSFYHDYLENQAVALNKLKVALSEKMKPLMINIESKKYYSLYNELRKFYRHSAIIKLKLNQKSLFDAFKADKQFIASLVSYENACPEKIPELDEAMKEFLNLSKMIGFGVEELQRKNIGIFKLFIGFFGITIFSPFAFYGFVNNALAWQLPRFAASLINDKQFHSSLKYVLSMLLFPLFYIVQTIVFESIAGNWLQSLFYFISLPLSGIIAWHWWKFGLQLLRYTQFFVQKEKKSIHYIRINELYAKLMAFADKAFDK